MNHNALRYITWSNEDLMRYFGLRKGLKSQYLRQRDFKPGVLAEVQPKQLHETETHPGFIPVKMDESGYHEMARPVMDMLAIEIPYQVMRKAVEYLDTNKPDLGATLYAAQHRLPSATWEKVAEQLNLHRTTLADRLERAMQDISDWLDLHYQVLANQSAS